MKKIVASVGLVALGASAVQAESALTSEPSKPWSVSATLRGFYDDNINSAPNALDLGPYKRDSFGFEVSPSVILSWPMEQTSISAGYTYSYKWFENQLAGTAGKDEQSHLFNLALDHAFSERYQASVKDSFVIGQEPDLLRTGNAMTTFQVVPGDNIRNYGAIDFDGKLTRLLGYELGYANTYYSYSDKGDNGITPSIGGLLDRMEHYAHVDSRWQLQPETVGIIGYQFRQINYTGDEVFAPGVTSSSRDSRNHYGYVGLDHTFTPSLSGSLRAGGEYVDYYNFGETTVSPYVLISLRYTYIPGSYLEVGFTHDRNATDTLGFTGDSFTLDQESSIVYFTVNHKITEKLHGSIIGQFQDSVFHGGAFNNESERFWMAGVNLQYDFSRNFSAEIGYNYDRLDSDMGDLRNLDRNRVYIGLTARY